MTSKIMSVFYGEDKLPYKDRERKVHYPILEGSLITGENNTRTIRCYTGLIGGSGRTWIANVKKPDGTLFYQLCTNAQTIDGEYSVDIDISSVYADTSGAIYIALQGYSGDVVITDEDDDGTYEISGNPEVFPTGTIKVLVNYAPQVLPKGETLSPTTEQLILAGFNAKLDKTSGIITVASLPISTLGYSANQLVYNKADGVLYIVQNNAFNEVSYCIDFKDIDITQASISVVANHLYFGKVAKGSDTPFADNLDVLYCFKDKSNGIVLANGNIYCLVGGTWYSNLNKDASGDVVAHEFYDGNSKTNLNKLVNTNALLSAITYLETYADGKETSAKAYTDALKNTKGQANGIAPLDANSKVDVSYIPTTIARTSECATFIQLTLDPTTYILKAKLISKDAVPLWEAQVDLPLETMVVSGSYDAVNKKIVLTLKNGQTIDIPVGDLVSGLISTSDIIDDCEHTDTNKPLSAKQGYYLANLIESLSAEMPTDIGVDTQTSEMFLEHDGTEISGQTRVKFKTIGGNSIFGDGNIPSGTDVIDDTTTATTKTWSSNKLNSELTNIREIAIGKKKAYVLSHNQVAPTSDNDFTYDYYEKLDGTRITSLADFNTYIDSKILNNSAFNSQANSISFTSNETKYLIFLKNDANNTKVVAPYNLLAQKISNGDDFLITNTDVPDRWFAGYGGSGYWYMLESKNSITPIDDTAIALDKTWSSSKINNGIATFTDVIIDEEE